ncbi:uncharacterized protein LOC124277098 isoform X2 [Haliotis rubra]|uniref:uncharacterized protein LOC124277098 isoform X2 n=1 Tax=Haliotis rubra TaxID=36100 RepID=UPI001EE5FA2E|nr:uncharacterized protein LOC124277098 isoform X2 [Haliotis rubra]
MEETIDRAHSEYPVHRTSGKDAEHKTSKEETIDREPGTNPVHRTSGKDATQKTSKEDTIDREPGTNPVHRSSCKDTTQKTSKEDTVDRVDPVHRTSGKDAILKTISDDNVDKTPDKDPVHRTSCKDAEHKTSKENTASKTCRSEDSGHVHAPIDVDYNGKTAPHLHTTSVTKSPNKIRIEEQGMGLAPAGGGYETEVFVRDDVVAEDQDTSSCGYMAGGSHVEVDNPDSIVSEPDNSSHVESEIYSKGTMDMQALLKECPSPKDKIEDHVLPTDNPSPEHIVELQDRPAVDGGSKGDGEEHLSIVGHMPTNIVEVETVTIVDIHPYATFHAQVDNVDVPADVPFSEETVGVPVVPAVDQIPPNTEQVQGLPALEPFQKDVKVEDLSDSTSQTSSSTVSSLLDGTDREYHKENVIPSRPVLDMGNSVPEEFGVEQSQHSNGKTDNTPTSVTGAQNNDEEDAWSYSDDECFV